MTSRHDEWSPRWWSERRLSSGDRPVLGHQSVRIKSKLNRRVGQCVCRPSLRSEKSLHNAGLIRYGHLLISWRATYLWDCEWSRPVSFFFQPWCSYCASRCLALLSRMPARKWNRVVGIVWPFPRCTDSNEWKMPGKQKFTTKNSSALFKIAKFEHLASAINSCETVNHRRAHRRTHRLRLSVRRRQLLKIATWRLFSVLHHTSCIVTAEQCRRSW